MPSLSTETPQCIRNTPQEEYKPYFIKKGRSKGQTRNKWTQIQHNHYVKFLKNNISFFDNEQTRREKKVFFRASKIIKTKTCTQIKSHHQKMMVKYGNKISNILKHQCSIQAQNSLLQQIRSTNDIEPSAPKDQNQMEVDSIFEQQNLDKLYVQVRDLFEWQREEEMWWARQEELDVDLFFTPDIL